MVYSLNYRRPAYVSPPSRNSVDSTRASVASGNSGSSHGIPEALGFNRVVAGGTCPPCTPRDFMNYLLYIELAAENLQFYLWLRSYTERFESLPESEKALSPPCAFKNEGESMSSRGPKAIKGSTISPETAAVFKNTDFQTPAQEKLSPFDDDAYYRDKHLAMVDTNWDTENSTLHSSSRLDHHKATTQAFEGADVKLQPFTIQPFREEISRIIATYIIDGAPRQLNLASKERLELLQSLATSTHPSAFRNINRTVEWSLKHQAHPNFIRWTICNGNRPRVIFARGLGIGGIVGGIIIAVLLTLSHNSRPWRILAAFPFMIGISTLFAAWKGMCVVLHGMHHRHLRPWELFADPDEIEGSSYDLKNDSMESFGTNNSYENEPWVAKYERRNVVRKVFDREVWIQEPALRQIQDTIFIQALLCAALVTAVVVGVFCAIPMGNVI